MFVLILMSLSARVPKSLTDVAPPVGPSQSRFAFAAFLRGVTKKP